MSHFQLIKALWDRFSDYVRQDGCSLKLGARYVNWDAMTINYGIQERKEVYLKSVFQIVSMVNFRARYYRLTYNKQRLFSDLKVLISQISLMGPPLCLYLFHSRIRALVLARAFLYSMRSDCSCDNLNVRKAFLRASMAR